jgi:uncharacterized membrane protein
LKPFRWFGIIIAFTLITLIFVYFIPVDSPLVWVRFFFGFVFVAFLPGYCLINLMFVKQNRLELVEELILSVALSFGLAGVSGLFLGLSPVGINFTSIIISLTVIVVVLASLAFFRKNKILRELDVQGSKQVSA